MKHLLTDERLKSWLDGNQPARERLCTALLALDPRFSCVRPRRPRGGPDGRRDIEALFEEELEVWGAVGFRNGANDSKADKKWIKAKFIDDLAGALGNNPSLECFVFFTNVDLTPREVNSLQRVALRKGVKRCEVFFRERLRMILDSPEGLALRYQYLDIDLTSSEQATFFARWGSTLENNLLKSVGALNEKLSRIEFYHECNLPLRFIGVRLHLRERCRMADILDVGVVVVVESRGIVVGAEPPRPYLVALFDVVEEGTIGSRVWATSSKLWWGMLPKNTPTNSGARVDPNALATDEMNDFVSGDGAVSGNGSDAVVKELVLYHTIETAMPRAFSTLGDFDRSWLHIFINHQTKRRVQRIDFVINDFVVASNEVDALSAESAKPDDPFLARVLTSEATSQWLEVVEGPTRGETLPPLCYVDYAFSIPARLSKPRVAPTT